MLDRLSDFIYARGFTRQQLAADAHVALSTLERLFAGHGAAQRKTVRKLSKFLKVPEERVRKMLKRDRIMQMKSESLVDISRATAICRAVAKGASPMDGTKAAKYLLSLQTAVSDALRGTSGRLEEGQGQNKTS